MISLKTPLPGPRSRQLMEERLRHVPRGPFHVTPVFAAAAKGAYIEDVDGNRLLDFSSGIGVTNVGHCADEVVAAVKAQVDRSVHTSFNVVPYEGYVRVAERLNAAAPGEFPKKTFLANSGAEAVENAVKIARAHTGRQAVVCFEHAYHGRTYLAMALTAKAKPYKAGFAPFPAEVYRVPFPYPYRWPTTSDPETVARECFQLMSDRIQAEVGPQDVAAVILEPVLGEGGFVPVTPAFFRRLREYCTRHGIVMIADEVQTGFGRTGTLFACEQLGAAPDLVVTAKGLAGGFPLSAVTGRAEMMDAPGEGGIGGTFGGNPVACAAALAVFDCFRDGELLPNARALGEAMEARMARWPSLSPAVGEVRGLGPMRAVELVKDRGTKEPHPQAAKDLVRYAYERGLVAMSCGTHGNVIRLLPPLATPLKSLNEGLAILEAGLASLR